MPGIPQFGARLLWSAALFVAIEGAIFRTGLYTRVLEPESSTGELQSYLYDEKVRRDAGPRQVLAIGHSRMGLRPRAANQIAAETGYTYSTIAMPGSTPRCWPYMLRDVDPSRSRYAAILVGVDEYDDEDFEDLADRAMDIRYLVPLLRWSDTWEFASSFTTWENRWDALRSSLFKGYAYRADFQDFLVRHRARLPRIARQRQESAGLRYEMRWGEGNVSGLAVDWKAGRVTPPPGSSPERRKLFEEVLLRPVIQQTGDRGRYLRHWYGRIVDYYRGTRTRVVFLQLPRGPVVRPVRFAPKSAAVREFAGRPGVHLLREDLFHSLERPEYFSDPLHLNEPGSVLFSHIAAREVRAVLGP